MEQTVVTGGADAAPGRVGTQDELVASINGERKQAQECEPAPSSSSRGMLEQSAVTSPTTDSSLATNVTLTTDGNPTGATTASGDGAPPSLGGPNVMSIEIVSTVPTSSAFPMPFGIATSQRGLWIAAYSDSVLYLMYARALPNIQGDGLRISRKPVAVAMQELSDYTVTLAILTTKYRVDLYSYEGGCQEGADSPSMTVHLRTIHLEQETTDVTIAPTNDILATACIGGVQLYHLGAQAKDDETRCLRSDNAQTVSFSNDGHILLLTSTVKAASKASVIYSLHDYHATPVTDNGSPIPQELHEKWLTRVHFPDKLKRVRQASIMHDPTTGGVNEVFAFDLDQDTWGIYDVGDKRFVGKHMLLPSNCGSARADLVGSTPAAISYDTRYVAVGLEDGKTCSIWLYEMPESYARGMSVYGDAEEHGRSQSELEPCTRVSLETVAANHQWIRALKWVYPSTSYSRSRRLVAVSTEAMHVPMEGEHLLSKTASGRIVLMDFNTSHASGFKASSKETQVDLDEALALQKLPDPSVSFDYEVHLARSRTTAERRRRRDRQDVQLVHDSIQTTLSPEEARPINQVAYNRPLQRARVEQDHRRRSSVEATFVMEEPYTQSQPRSQAILQRAATVAAVSPAARRHLRSLPGRPLEYRRADGLREAPHESDADNWVPPPPPYSAKPDPHAPALALRRSRSENSGDTSLQGFRVNDEVGRRRFSILSMPSIAESTEGRLFSAIRDGPERNQPNDRRGGVPGSSHEGPRSRRRRRCIVM